MSTHSDRTLTKDPLNIPRTKYLWEPIIFCRFWPWRQCNMNIKFSTEYEYEYICNGKFHRIRISNIFVFCKLVEYEYRIYSFLANGRIRISNVFVLRTFVEYEYRIYSKQENLIFVFEYLIFGAKYSNIWIYSFYTVKFGKSQHANIKNLDDLKN